MIAFLLICEHYKQFFQFSCCVDITGQGIGKLMMNTVFEAVIEQGDVKTLTVNTNTLDHKSALPLYQKAGFSIYKTEDHERSAWSQFENKEYL